MKTRIRMTEIMEYWAGKGKKEVGGNNLGPFVTMLQRADRLAGEGYAWCQSTLNGAHRLSTGGAILKSSGRWDIFGGEFLAGGTASVGFFLDAAKRNDWIVQRPLRGDAVCFSDTPGGWPYHVGMVSKVIKLGPLMTLKTVEGNTSITGPLVSDPGTGRDGVVPKWRVVRRDKLTFVRIPGEASPIFKLPTEWGKK